jgi:hypothetical protein
VGHPRAEHNSVARACRAARCEAGSVGVDARGDQAQSRGSGGARQEGEQGHASQHGGDEEEEVAAAADEVDEGGAGAQADQAPADAEQGGAEDEAEVELARWGREVGGEARGAEGVDADGRAEHDHEAGVPARAGEVEEGEHALRIEHAAEAEAEGEDEAADEGAEPHGAPPIRWRVTNTVRKAVAMKVRTATSERGERRPRPQTP